MNRQKINELAVKAGAYWREGYVQQPNGDSVWQDKASIDHCDMNVYYFTSLIVKECAQVANDSNQTKDRVVGVSVGDVIRNHFDMGGPQEATIKQQCSICHTTENVTYVGGYHGWLCTSTYCTPF